MNDAIQTIEYKGCTIEVFHDDDPMSPRGDCNVGVILSWHRDITLGEIDMRRDDLVDVVDDYGSFENWARERYGAVGPVLAVYLMDHSGYSVRCDSTMFEAADSQGWDWGQVGLIFATAATLETTGVPLDQVEEVLRAEIGVLDDYFSGRVYGYTAEDADGEIVGSCWGFYDTEYNENNDDVHHCYMLGEAASEIDYHVEQTTTAATAKAAALDAEVDMWATLCGGAR